MVPVERFIKDHTYINYCEAIIYKDGCVEYARPSHVEMLIRITGEHRDVIYDKMPITASPIIWLTEYTGCVSVWSDGYILPTECTPDQQKSVEALIAAKLVANNNFRKVMF